MTKSKEKQTPHQFTLEANLHWIFEEVMKAKGLAVTMFLMFSTNAESDPFKGKYKAGLEPFIKWSLTETGIDLTWPSLEKDAQTLLKAINLLISQNTPDNEQETFKKLKKILKESPLFQALDSTSIVVTKAQQSNGDTPPTPLNHILSVTSEAIQVLNTTTDAKDEQNNKHLNQTILLLACLMHDIGKMAGVNFLKKIMDQGEDKIEDAREYLKKCFDDAGKHTHPKHAFVGVLIAQKILKKAQAISSKNDQTTPKAHEFINNSDSISLLLSIIFTHHKFLYTDIKEDTDEEVIKKWIQKQIETHLEPILSNKLLIPSFFSLFIKLRFADIKATPAHHKYWAQNKIWMRQIPAVLSEIFLTDKDSLNTTEEDKIEQEIKLIEKILEQLPDEIT